MSVAGWWRTPRWYTEETRKHIICVLFALFIGNPSFWWTQRPCETAASTGISDGPSNVHGLYEWMVGSVVSGSLNSPVVCGPVWINNNIPMRISPCPHLHS